MSSSDKNKLNKLSFSDSVSSFGINMGGDHNLELGFYTPTKDLMLNIGAGFEFLGRNKGTSTGTTYWSK